MIGVSVKPLLGDFTPTEAVEMGRVLEELESQRAKERQVAQDFGRGVTCGKFPQVTDSGKTRDKVGQAVGISGKSYEMAKAVVEVGCMETLVEIYHKGVLVKPETKYVRRWCRRGIY